MSCVAITFCYLVMPESPKHDYNKLKFEKVRDTIEYMKRMNGEKHSRRNADGFMFDTERDIKMRGNNMFVIYQRDRSGLNEYEEGDENEALVRYRPPEERRRRR